MGPIIVDAELTCAVCKMLGLDPKQVVSVTLHFSADAPMASVKFIPPDQIGEAVSLIENYRLVPITP